MGNGLLAVRTVVASETSEVKRVNSKRMKTRCIVYINILLFKQNMVQNNNYTLPTSMNITIIWITATDCTEDDAGIVGEKSVLLQCGTHWHTTVDLPNFLALLGVIYKLSYSTLFTVTTKGPAKIRFEFGSDNSDSIRKWRADSKFSNRPHLSSNHKPRSLFNKKTSTVAPL